MRAKIKLFRNMDYCLFHSSHVFFISLSRFYSFMQFFFMFLSSPFSAKVRVYKPMLFPNMDRYTIHYLTFLFRLSEST